MKKIINLIPVLLSTAIFTLSACKKADLNDPSINPSSKSGINNNNSTLQVNMTSSDPGMYKEVNVDIRLVEAGFSDGNGGTTWMPMNTNAGAYHLVAMQGTVALLATANIPGQTGRTIHQLRVMFGDANSVELGDLVYSMQLADNAKSGVIVDVNRKLNSENESLLINFDAAASVGMNEIGQYILQPVITLVR